MFIQRKVLTLRNCCVSLATFNVLCHLKFRFAIKLKSLQHGDYMQSTHSVVTLWHLAICTVHTLQLWYRFDVWFWQSTVVHTTNSWRFGGKVHQNWLTTSVRFWWGDKWMTLHVWCGECGVCRSVLCVGIRCVGRPDTSGTFNRNFDSDFDDDEWRKMQWREEKESSGSTEADTLTTLIRFDSI